MGCYFAGCPFFECVCVKRRCRFCGGSGEAASLCSRVIGDGLVASPTTTLRLPKLRTAPGEACLTGFTVMTKTQVSPPSHSSVMRTVRQEAKAEAASQGIVAEQVEEEVVELPVYPLPATFTPGGFNKTVFTVLGLALGLFGAWTIYQGIIDPEQRFLLIGIIPFAASIFVFVKVARLRAFSFTVSEDGIAWQDGAQHVARPWNEISHIVFNTSGLADYVMAASSRRHRVNGPTCVVTTAHAEEVVLTETNVERFRRVTEILRVECMRRDVVWSESRGSGSFERMVNPADHV